VEALDLRQALQDSMTRDLRLKTTHVGPHRADISFVVEGVAAKDRVSRGQQKMLAAAFILAQLQCHTSLGAAPTTLMLDDPAAELDVDNLGKLLSVIAEIPSQLIVTSVHEQGLRGIEIGRRFHVEQGRFQPML
jgi:DNA replication and repair protein RecF